MKWLVGRGGENLVCMYGWRKSLKTQLLKRFFKNLIQDLHISAGADMKLLLVQDIYDTKCDIRNRN